VRGDRPTVTICASDCWVGASGRTRETFATPEDHRHAPWTSRTVHSRFWGGRQARARSPLKTAVPIPPGAPSARVFPGSLRIHGKMDDVAEASSKGLLPELVDVLRALTDSQTLLAQRVRRACLEYQGGGSPLVNERLPGQALDPSRQSRVLVAANPKPRSNQGEQPDQSVQATTSSAFDTAASTTHQGIGAATVNADRIEAPTPPSQTSGAATASVDHPDTRPRETALRPDWPESTRREDTGRPAATRDYNFFDELDAELAGLPGTKVRDDEGEPPEESVV